MNFGSIIAPISDCLKGAKYKWTKKIEDNFQLIKTKLICAPILILPYFEKAFEVDCDAFHMVLESS